MDTLMRWRQVVVEGKEPGERGRRDALCMSNQGLHCMAVSTLLPYRNAAGLKMQGPLSCSAQAVEFFGGYEPWRARTDLYPTKFFR